MFDQGERHSFSQRSGLAQSSHRVLLRFVGVRKQVYGVIPWGNGLASLHQKLHNERDGCRWVFPYRYFEDGLKTLKDYQSFIHDISAKAQEMKSKQEEEKKQLYEMRKLLKGGSNSQILRDKTVTTAFSTSVNWLTTFTIIYVNKLIIYVTAVVCYQPGRHTCCDQWKLT